jgi:hypothetical protein
MTQKQDDAVASRTPRMKSERFMSVFMAIGALPLLYAFGLACAWFFRKHGLTPVYHYAEVVSVISLLLCLVMANVDMSSKRPWTHVPSDGAWWEFIIFGATVGVFGPLTLILMIGTFLILPVLLPFKILREYVFGSQATLVSAVVAVPLIAAATGFLFMMLYLFLMTKGRGSMRKDSQSIYDNKPGQGWPIADVLHFSLATMLDADTTVEPTGWCRWAALIQAAIAKVIEIIVVAIGVTLIIERVKK